MEEVEKISVSRRLLAGILAIATFVGGHYVNRRSDKALFFFGLMIFWILSCYGLILWFVSNHSASTVPNILFKYYVPVSLAGISIIYFLSALTSFIDSFREPAPVLKYSFLRSAGTIMITFAGAVLVYFCGISVYDFLHMPVVIERAELKKTDATEDKVWHIPDFTQYIYFGHTLSDKNGPPPPEGDGEIRGRVFYQGKPVTGLSMYLYLDEKYKSKRLVTDEEGRVHLKLPKKKWSINLITTENWKNRPEGEDFVIVSGREPFFSEDKSYSRFMFNQKDFIIDTGEERPGDDFTLTIRKTIKFTNPKRDENTTMSVKDGLIAWTPYDGAARYLLQIERIEKEGKTTTYYPVVQKIVDGASTVPLKSFDTVENDGNPVQYSAILYAFDEDNRFLTESAGYSRGATFQLEENLLIADRMKTYAYDDDREDEDSAESGDIDKKKEGKKRIKAVEVLIEAGMLDAAEELLANISVEEAGAGKKDGLRGYMEASKGNCEAAGKFFKLATDKGCCVPKKWRVACGK